MVPLAVAQNDKFNNFITAVILLAGLMVGIGTFDRNKDSIANENHTLIMWVDATILAVFTAEVVVKVIAKEFSPFHYFYTSAGVNSWNCFDFFVVVGSFIPGAGGLLVILRLLRLLRVLKLVKALPELQVIVVALINGIGSISYIGVIMVMVFYLFSIVSIIFFRDNDPWHFGDLHNAMLTLFRCATLEDWTDVVYINWYGCNHYGYAGMETLCTCNDCGYWWAPLYFVFFTVIAALVLLTLFIGVVTTSMEEATNKQEEQGVGDLPTQHSRNQHMLRAHALLAAAPVGICLLAFWETCFRGHPSESTADRISAVSLSCTLRKCWTR